jgi:glucose/arabinose dehydrogenase
VKKIDFCLWKTRKSIFIALSVGIIIVINALVFYDPFFQTIHAHAQPSVKDAALSVEPVVEGLSSPTSMIFLDDNNILVLQKDGQVRHVANGILQEQPVLQIPVNTTNERGLLGIATSNSSNVNRTTSDIFLYYTEVDPLRNRIYKYLWNGETLINPALILDLPADPGPNHNAGKIVIGPDDYLYAVIGDLNRDGQLQNFRQGPPPDNTSVILRVNPVDGSAASGNPFANSGNESLSRYYAYGIRNSFGMDFDPLTGHLWDTENGPTNFDEINLVRPGFNSGWQTVMGPISLSGDTEDDLVHFPGSQYADPIFSWADPVAPTDIEFFSSSKLGAKYANNIFVGDIITGNLYFFEVNENRDGISHDTAQQQSGLSDFVANSEDELSAITFGSGFGGITDIETGPDGSLYILSYEKSYYYTTKAIIYKISSTTAQ